MEVGASRSVRLPKTRRAIVEVIATIDTCVAAEVGITEGFITGGYRVLMMVPRLVMKASPGPAHYQLGPRSSIRKTYRI
jgi:hypothetical protein